jgi:hypothetical protein
VRVTRTRFSSRGPAAQRGTVLTFRLRRSGTVELVVRGANCSVLGLKRLRGHRGLNRVRFDGRLHGRPLAPGRYTIVLAVVRGSTQTRLGAIAVEIVPPGRRLSRAQRIAPLSSDCAAAVNAPALPVPLASTAGPLAVAGAVPSKPLPGPTNKKSRTGVLGVSLKPPRVLVPMGGAPAWLGALLLGVFGLAGAAVAVYLTRYLRGSWHP